MDADNRRLLADVLRDATCKHTGEALDDALDVLGWRDALAEDPRVAVSVLFELQGGANATSTALDDVVANAAGASREPGARIVLPVPGGHGAPGTVTGDDLVVRGLIMGATAGTVGAVVVARAEGGHVAVAVGADDLRMRAVSGMDPDLRLTEVVTRRPLRMATARRPAATWDAAVRAARLALGHELIGASRTMLRLARDHAVGRVQFGRPIASFQAVRHRLADALVAIEAAQAAVDAAWTDPSPLAPALAKAVAGRNARSVARHAQQVLAGMGFTTEHALHRHVRRTLVLDTLFGSARSLTEEVGAEVVRSRRLPPMLAL